ncbi:excisionase family DNA-binding protein [Demequina sp.]|uniref:excisionase family DNA-binding protein n=1 Tax=Demequina sp. TaxID=2050685 RepID=UPI003A88787E
MPITLRAGAGRTELAASSTEISAAQRLTRLNSAATVSAEPLMVPAELHGMVQAVIAAVARGETVTVGTLPDELSTSVAAEQLGVSRPTLMKLIAEGSLKAHKVGTHTRVKTEDVTQFRRERLERQRDAFESLRALEDELGI